MASGCVIPAEGKMAARTKTGQIGGHAVRIIIGDASTQEGDVVFVPQYAEDGPLDDTGRALLDAGAEAGMTAYEDLVARHGPQKEGSVHLCASGGPFAPYLMHGVVLGSGPDKEFETVQAGVRNASDVCGQAALGRLVLPALGLDDLSCLSPRQSAEAMMAGLLQHSESGGAPVDVTIVVPHKEEAINRSAEIFSAFARVFDSGSYRGAAPAQRGERANELAVTIDGMDIGLPRPPPKPDPPR